MPEFTESATAPIGPASPRCPMCGAERTRSDPACPACGERFDSAVTREPPNERKLLEWTRALFAMHLLLGVFSLAGGVIGVLIALEGQQDTFLLPMELSVASCVLLGWAHLWVAPGVRRRSVIALKYSVLVSALTLLWFVTTGCLIVLAIFQIAGIAQAFRILGMVQHAERELETAE
jgi:hypothetical protein